MKTSAPLFLFFFFFFIWFDLQLCFGDDAAEEFKACGVVYNCGELVNISYPYWGNERKDFCGRRELGLNCIENKTTTIEINSLEFNVLNISQSDHRMRIARSDLFDDYCPSNQIETARLDYHLLVYSTNDRNISVWYDCPPQQGILEDYRFWCDPVGERNGRVNYALEPEAMNLSRNISGCKMNIEVTVTIKGLEEGIKNRTTMLEKAVRQGFEVEYMNLYTVACEECTETGGKCGGNRTYPFYCICATGDAHPYVCFSPPPSKSISF